MAPTFCPKPVLDCSGLEKLPLFHWTISIFFLVQKVLEEAKDGTFCFQKYRDCSSPGITRTNRSPWEGGRERAFARFPLPSSILHHPSLPPSAAELVTNFEYTTAANYPVSIVAASSAALHRTSGAALSSSGRPPPMRRWMDGPRAAARTRRQSTADWMSRRDTV